MTPDGSTLLWSALILAASAVSAGCSSSHESSGDADGGTDGRAVADDGGGPDTDGAAPSCPASYADITEGATCPGTMACDYYGQFHCECRELTSPPTPLQWQCVQLNCICLSSDAGPASCVNQACNTEADCPSGQHCGWQLGYQGPVGGSRMVCSVGCEGDAGPGGPTASCPSGGTCERIAP